MDYPEAVKDGKVADQGEYDEQVEFAASVRAMIGALPVRPERAGLEAAAARLAAAIRDKRSGDEVATIAGELRGRIILVYQVRVSPRQAPDLASAPADYATHCAVCHGATGRGDGPAAKGLTPPPADLTDAARQGQLSVFGLYNTITLGIKGTAMTGFPALSEAQRWALAFHVSTLAGTRDERARGAALWKGGTGRGELGDLRALVMATPREVTARLGGDGAAVLAYLRGEPGAVGAGRESALDRSARLLGESVGAYRQGDAVRAHRLAVTGYLEGFELVEAPLSAVDGALKTRVETEMMRYRSMLQAGAPVDAVEAQARAIQALLVTARQRLDAARLSPATIFTSALVILLREGLEAILVVAALIALLIKSGRREALRYVHAGWIAALALGGADLGGRLLPDHPERGPPRDHRGRHRPPGRRHAPLRGLLDAPPRPRGPLEGLHRDARGGRALRAHDVGARVDLLPRGLPRGVRDRALLSGALARGGRRGARRGGRGLRRRRGGPHGAGLARLEGGPRACRSAGSSASARS